jgi:OOP family OmpA-OmpF porin
MASYSMMTRPFSWCGLVVLFIGWLTGGTAAAQPADDPGLTTTPPPPVTPPTTAPATSTIRTVTETPPPDTHETVDTQVTWLPGTGPAVGDDDLYARVAAPTVFGPIGLFRVITGDVGRSNNFRVGLSMQVFSQDNFLVSSAGGINGDNNKRFLGNLTIDYTPWKYLELYLGIYNSSNQNTRPEMFPQRTDPEVILALGDVGAGLKGRLPLAKWFDLALHLGVRFFNSISSVSVAGSATNFLVDAIGSFDLRHAAATARVPLRFHINFGYVLDNSINLLPNGQCATSTGNDPCVRSRLVEKFGYGIEPSRLRLALAVDAPIAVKSVGIEPFVEYHGEFAVGDKDHVFVPLNSNRGDQHWLTIGLRVRPVAGLVLDAGIDLGLGSFGFSYGTPQPTWNVLLGAAYAYDPGLGSGRTKLVTKTVTREISRNEGKLRGFVRDATSRKPVIGAIIRYTTRRATSQLSAEDGSFLSYGFPPGPLSIEVSRDDYETARIDTSVPPNGDTPLEVLLTAKPPQNGLLTGKVSNADGAPVRATVRLTNNANGSVIEADPEGAGGFTARLPASDYVMDVTADGYLAKQRVITMVAGQPLSVEVVLRKKPTVTHVTLGKSAILIKGTIHFATNAAEIRPDSEQLLDEVADLLVKHPEIRRVRVEGHTDNRGGAEHNLQLSKARAAAVVAYLTKQGIDPARLDSQGYGLTQPLVPNMTPAQRAKNRRVAFKILDRGGAPRP